jgi:threonine dehydrogenase-like Zn-dependent dehydrogenase
VRALGVTPGTAGSARLVDRPEPTAEPDELLVEGLALGVCGTDHEIVAGEYGWPAEGRSDLVLGHESLGRVVTAPPGSGFVPGDHVVGIVRRPDPVPCPACAIGQWDMCRNGRYREHGIKELDGFAAERFCLAADAAIDVGATLGDAGVLVEPASVVAKAWDHIERIGARAAWFPRRVLVTGAGPVGLLAALMAVQRGHDVHVLDRVTSGPKPELVRALGATYHHGEVEDACGGADVVVECTGDAHVVWESVRCTGPSGIVCLTGVSSHGRALTIDAGELNRRMVLENDVVFGSVNANAGHYRLAVEALERADAAWLAGVVTRRVPLGEWESALERRDDDVKVVIDLQR